MRVGRYEVAGLIDGYFAVDGGAMFGLVPRPVWERKAPPDPRNRIRLAVRTLLAIDRDGRRVILVDAGLGAQWDAKRTDLLGIDRAGGGLDAALAERGLSRDDVTDLVLTHLHFDHAGGATRRGPDGRRVLSFPRATHHVQRRAWQHAHAPSEREAPSFRAEDLELLQHSNLLHLVEGEVELFPEVDLIVSEGHTVGQQIPRFRGDGTHLTYCGDVIPTHLHLRPSWIFAGDLFPLTTLEEKKVLMAEALEDGGVLFFDHDAEMAACRLGEENGAPVFREAVEL